MSESASRATALGATALKGGAILGATGLFESGILFLRALLLARILTPVDFGLMGMAFVVVQAGDAFSQTGFHQALVQKRGDVTAYLDTVFWVTFLRGLALFVIVWLLAPFAGVFFSTEAAVPVIRTVALSFLILGVENPALSLLERDFAFARSVAPRITSTLVEGILSVILAITLRSVWAMVWGFLLGRAAMVMASYIVRPYAPAFKWEKDQIREFRSYGKHIFRGIAVGYVASQADKAIVGRALGAEALGLYSFAWRLAFLPTSVFAFVLRVAFPVFSSIQEDAVRRRSGFLRTLCLMTAIAAPISAGTWSVSSDLVTTVFGEKWIGMLPPLQVLCLGGTLMIIYNLLGMIIGAVGRPDTAAHGTYIFLAVIVLTVYPATLQWGTVGTALSVILAGIVAGTFLLVVGMRIFGCNGHDLLKGLAPSILASAGMGGTIFLARQMVATAASPLLLAVEIGFGVILYLGLLSLLDFLFDSGQMASLRGTLRALDSGKRAE